MRLKIRFRPNVFSKLRIQIYFNRGFAQELVMRFTAAILLLIAAITMDSETLGINTFIGSLALCSASIFNPGYLHRINSTSHVSRISYHQAIREWRLSTIGIFVVFPLVIYFLIDVSLWLKLSCCLGYASMYGTLAFRDIQVARIRNSSISTNIPFYLYMLEIFLGFLIGLLLFVSKQPFLIPLGTLAACLPMLIRLDYLIRVSRNLFENDQKQSHPYSWVSLKFAIFGVISSVLMVTDNFVVFGLLGLSDLGHYGVAYAIVTFVVNVFGTTLQRQEFLTNSGNKPKTRVDFLLVAVLSALLLSVTVVIVGNLYQLQNLKVSGLLALVLCTGVAFRITNLHVTVIIEKFGTFKERFYSLISSISILTIFCFSGTSVFGLYGLCVSTSFSYFLIFKMNSHLSQKISTRIAGSQ